MALQKRSSSCSKRQRYRAARWHPEFGITEMERTRLIKPIEGVPDLGMEKVALWGKAVVRERKVNRRTSSTHRVRHPDLALFREVVRGPRKRRCPALRSWWKSGPRPVKHGGGVSGDNILLLRRSATSTYPITGIFCSSRHRSEFHTLLLWQKGFEVCC